MTWDAFVIAAAIGLFAPLALAGNFLLGRAAGRVWVRRRDARARARVLAHLQPFIASNGRIVEISIHRCGHPECPKSRIVAIDPDDNTSRTMAALPSPGNAHDLARILRSFADASTLRDTTLQRIDAIVEFYDRLAIAELEESQ